MAADRTDVVREWDMDALQEAVERGGPPTPDDVSVTWDGRRLDSREAVVAFLDEVNRERAERDTGATA
jgi:hypothetical protein